MSYSCRKMPLWYWVAVGKAVLSIIGLASCTTTPLLTLPSYIEPANLATLQNTTNAVSGTVVMRVYGANKTLEHNLHAIFELQNTTDQGELNLTTPFGSLIAHIQWHATQVHLTTPQSKREYASLAHLSQDLWGTDIPLYALSDWLSGQPWGGAIWAPWPTTPNIPRTALAGFQQLGWTINLHRLGSGIIEAQRIEAPVVVLNVRLHS